jgi:hypothetical protein
LFVTQAATFLPFAKQTGNPKLAAVPLHKTAELNEKVEDVSLQIIDISRQTRDMERRT